MLSRITMRSGIALGSNVGDRLKNLQRAVEMLVDENTESLKKANVYETAPVDCAEDSPSYFNTVIEIETELNAEALLTRMQVIESVLGRPPDHGFHEPRTIDLDILYLGDTILKSEMLQLPHPGITERRFVLQPLADICAGLILPGQEKSVAELLETLDSSEPPLKLIASEW